MCDTILVKGKLTKSGKTVFGKASDRGVNEPQPLVYSAAADHAPGSKVKCTYIEVEQAPHTYSTILSKPSWIWGAEIGVNEHGVVIGNEAVLTKELKTDEKHLLGMDILRIALERAKTAKEAVNVIAEMMDKYGQGGNASFDGEFYYENAYLITDGTETYDVETAGTNLWVAKKIEDDTFSISNYVCMQTPDCMSEKVIATAKAKGYEIYEPFDFAKTFVDWTSVLNTSGMLRRCCTYTMANRNRGQFEDVDMIEALRTHYTTDPWTKGDNAVCMHAKRPEKPGDLDCETTAAMVATCAGKDTLIWGSAMGVTCVAPFQPLWFDAFSKKQVFTYDRLEEGMDEWVKREGISRAIIDGRIPEAEYKKEMAEMEARWHKQVAEVDSAQASRQALCDAIADEAEAFIDKWLAYAKEQKSAPMGDEGFQSWWAAKNAALGKDRRIAY